MMIWEGCVWHVSEKIHPGFPQTKVQERDRLEDHDIDETIRLNWILKLAGG
jgi:hypothetical protein